MHYKDGTPAIIGDIVKHDNGNIGILIGGQFKNDYCSSQVVFFKKHGDYAGAVAGFVGTLRNSSEEGAKIISTHAVAVTCDSGVQTCEMIKIDHIDIGEPS